MSSIVPNLPDAPSLQQLALQIREIESGEKVREPISSGCQAIDGCLPEGGHLSGSLIELLQLASGHGGLTLALMLAKATLTQGKYLLVVDPDRQFYPPAIAAMGLPLERLFVLRPKSHSDLVWGIDQALRCEAVGSTIAPIQYLDDRVARRFQLAAEQASGLGILIRSVVSAKRYPSWANTQWRIHAPSNKQNDAPKLPQVTGQRWWDLELLRCKGGRGGARVRVGIDSRGEWINDSSMRERGPYDHVCLAAQLAMPTRRRREIAG